MVKSLAIRDIWICFDIGLVLKQLFFELSLGLRTIAFEKEAVVTRTVQLAPCEHILYIHTVLSGGMRKDRPG